MNFKKSLLFVCLASTFPLVASADDISNVANALHTVYPSTASVQASDISKAGPLYTFIFGGQRVYTDQKADYILVGGELLGRNSSGATVNLTPKDSSVADDSFKAAPVNATGFSSTIGTAPFKQTSPETSLTPDDPSAVFKGIPWDRTINFVYGKGERKILIIEDPDCPFCAQLEQSFESIGPDLNATVSILPIALPMHSKIDSGGTADSDKHASVLACSNNYAGNWRDWMAFSAKNSLDEQGQPVAPESNWRKWTVSKGLSPDASGTCAAAQGVVKNLDIAKKLYVSGTPTIIFTNGAVQNGVPASNAELLKLLNQGWAYVAAHPVVQAIKKQ